MLKALDREPVALGDFADRIVAKAIFHDVVSLDAGYAWEQFRQSGGSIPRCALDRENMRATKTPAAQ